MRVTVANGDMDHLDDGRRPLDAMCNEIVERHHVPLHRLIRRISEELAAIATASAPPAARALREIFMALENQVSGHLAKEEHLVFPALAALAVAQRTPPALRRSTFATVLYPIRLLEGEHLRIESLLDRLREAVQAVEDLHLQSETFQSCLADLADLDCRLRAHLRVENEVLFPRALEIERQVL